MKRLINITILLVGLISLYLVFVQNMSIPCIFKSLTGLPCPACGMTRALRHLMNLDIASAFKSNILAIPLVICGIVSLIVIVYDIIFSKDTFIKKSINLLSKYYILILISLVISLTYNIIYMN